MERTSLHPRTGHLVGFVSPVRSTSSSHKKAEYRLHPQALDSFRIRVGLTWLAKCEGMCWFPAFWLGLKLIYSKICYVFRVCHTLNTRFQCYSSNLYN